MDASSWELGITVRKRTDGGTIEWELNVGRTTVAELSTSLEETNAVAIRNLLRAAVQE
jgi:hypothetical protein